MKHDYDNAREWRERARQLRLLAKQMTHPKARNDLTEIVERWEGLAVGAEAKLRVSARLETKRQSQSELR
jgi:hypothetical protein